MLFTICAQLSPLVALLHFELKPKVAGTRDVKRCETVSIGALDARADAFPAQVADLIASTTMSGAEDPGTYVSYHLKRTTSGF